MSQRLPNSEPVPLTVHQCRQRYLEINEGRLARFRKSLRSQQQQCLDLIPLLFHINRPNFPGYIKNPSVPFGIANYQIDAATPAAWASFGLSAPAHAPVVDPKIHGIFVVGSSGSVAQATTSHLDIWLCYRPNLTDEQVQLLDTKAKAIQQWSEEYSVELNFHLLKASHFDVGQAPSLTNKYKGAAQHFLLLDEFYRTGLLLAGLPPMWWLTPDVDNDVYSKKYIANSMLGAAKTNIAIDFGDIPDLLPGELFSAGLWELYKGTKTPYKSVLKLLLLEIYAYEYPNTTSLATECKAAIQAGNQELDAVDPYIMLYRRIEQYLMLQKQPNRLELVRRCLYIEVGVALSGNRRGDNWRRKLMSKLVQEWHWTDEYITDLDNAANWSVRDIMKERKTLTNELASSYGFLTAFAEKHKSNHRMKQQDLLILNRKLRAAFYRRRGKIDFIDLGASGDRSPERVRIEEVETEQPPGSKWVAYSQAPADRSWSIIKVSNGLLETLLWCHLNGLLSAQAHIPVLSKTSTINPFELRKTLADLRHSLPADQPVVAQTQFYKPVQIDRIVVFNNLGCDPLQRLTRRGLQKVSSRFNSLAFSAQRESLILTIDMIIINSWGEVMVKRFDQGDILTEAINCLLSLLSRQKHKSRPTIESYCHNQTHPQAIARRIQDLFEDSIDAFLEHSQQQEIRFLYNLGEQYRVITTEAGQLQNLPFNTEEALLNWLGKEQEKPSKLIPDRHFETKQNCLLAAISQQIDEGMSLVFQGESGQATLYFIDEYGSLLHFRQSYHEKIPFLTRFMAFLQSCEHYQRTKKDSPVSAMNPTQCVELNCTDGFPMILPIQLPESADLEQTINIQAIVGVSSEGTIEYVMKCNDQVFSSQELGKDFYLKIADHILSLRQDRRRYPFHISTLRLSPRLAKHLPNGQVQTSHYLRYKLQLEKRTNEAMKLIQ